MKISISNLNLTPVKLFLVVFLLAAFLISCADSTESNPTTDGGRGNFTTPDGNGGDNTTPDGGTKDLGIPVANPRSFEMYVNDTISVNLFGTDSDGNIVSWRIESRPSKGTADLKDSEDTAAPQKSVLTYSSPSETGIFTVEVVATDNEGQDSNVAKIIFDVKPVDPAAPVVTSITGEVYAENVVDITLTADPGSVSWEISGQPLKGSVDIVDSNIARYTAGSESGTDVFQVRATDSDGRKSLSTTITVTINPLPTAVSQTVNITPGSTKTITLTVTDDPNGGFNSFEVTEASRPDSYDNPNNGNILTYTAGPTVGTETLKFRATNSDRIQSKEGTITFNVEFPATSVTLENICSGSAIDDLLVEINANPILKHMKFSSGDTVTCRYVKTDGSPLANGNSWDSAWGPEALRDPDTTITNATATNKYLLLVKEGIYKPDDGTDRDVWFNLASHIFVFGGFSGIGFKEGGETELSGDLNGNDASSEADDDLLRSDNTKSLVRVKSGLIFGLIANVKVSGAYGYGGALYVTDGEVNLVQVNFTRNYTENDGGAISLINANLNVYSSVFTENIAERNGGAIYGGGSQKMVIENSEITKNKAKTRDGGGLYIVQYQQTTILRNSLVSENTAINGGGLAILSTTNIISSTIQGNHAGKSGGGIHVFSAKKANIISSTISGNTADLLGKGIYIDQQNSLSFTYITNSILWGNNIYSFTNSVESPGKFSMTYSNYSTDAINSDDPAYQPILIKSITQNPNLSPPAEKTMAISETSPVINQGTYTAFDSNNIACFDTTPDGETRTWVLINSTDFSNPSPCTPVDEITTDGRGYTITDRPDIGAYEYGAMDQTP